ncbi:MAG: Hsp20/alpha crystallin family protein [Halobacteriales archaeon]
MSRLREALADLPGAAFADLLEDGEAYRLVIDLPGATAATTDLEITTGRLRIEARREKAVPEGFRYEREDRSLFIDADLPLPPDAGAEGASATIERGVLEVTLPKRSRSAGRTVPVEDA